LTNSSFQQPVPRLGFETDLVQAIKDFVATLPSGTASLRIGRIKGHPEWAEPDFEVSPANQKAARFGGYAVANDLYLTIGEAEREFVGFAKGGTVFPSIKWQTELNWIWQSVVAGGITQHQYLNSSDQIIGWAMRFEVNGHTVVFRNGRRVEKLFGREHVRTITYEPYCVARP
jgi:hypothetical protein